MHHTMHVIMFSFLIFSFLSAQVAESNKCQFCDFSSSDLRKTIHVIFSICLVASFFAFIEVRKSSQYCIISPLVWLSSINYIEWGSLFWMNFNIPNIFLRTNTKNNKTCRGLPSISSLSFIFLVFSLVAVVFSAPFRSSPLNLYSFLWFSFACPVKARGPLREVARYTAIARAALNSLIIT